MNKVRVGLVQVNNSFSGQNYLPYSVGILQAYAQEHLRAPERFEFLPPLYRRAPVDSAVEPLMAADVAFFSVYVWNVRISLEIARRLKQRKPDSLVVFGGPHVPERCDDFLRTHRHVDILAHGEGEQTFAAVLENMSRARWNEIPSVSFLDGENSPRHTHKAPRLRDLSKVPSPYLSGVFDPLMRAHPEEKWIALWETNRGCPFFCTFCDWGSATRNKIVPFSLERVLRELDWFAEKRIDFVFCADANFGILPRDVDIAKHAAKVRRERGYPKALSVQNTKNATDRAYQIQKTLTEAGLGKGVTISFQSLDDGTLRNVRRTNISTKSFQELQTRFNREDIETYSDIILGLPGETYESFRDGVSLVIENGQHNRIQFNNLSILPNAEMAEPAYREKHGIETVVSKVVNLHGTLTDSPGTVSETQELVVATASMPRKDWVRVRAFAWWASLCHFDKLLQIPFLLLRELAGLRYGEMIESFSEDEFPGQPVLRRMRRVFLEKAREIQDGGPEYVHAPEDLNMWWPADEYALIRLCRENELDTFYVEARETLERLLRKAGRKLPPGLLEESLRLNRCLMKTPFQKDDVELALSYNILAFYEGILRNRPVPLKRETGKCRIDRTSNVWNSWEDWCREVVWWGNKKGAYLYGRKAEPQLSGHH